MGYSLYNMIEANFWTDVSIYQWYLLYPKQDETQSTLTMVLHGPDNFFSDSLAYVYYFLLAVNRRESMIWIFNPL